MNSDDEMQGREGNDIEDRDSSSQHSAQEEGVIIFPTACDPNDISQYEDVNSNIDQYYFGGNDNSAINESSLSSREHHHPRNSKDVLRESVLNEVMKSCESEDLEAFGMRAYQV